MRILAIETSCDDTGIALVDVEKQKKSEFPRVKVVENLIASQTALHAKWGGVVPNLAKQAHIDHLPILYKKLSTFNFSHSIDYVAVTVGPGLEPALWAGIEFAKKISKELKIPIVGANHLEGHLYSFLLQQKTVVESKKKKVERKKLQFPVVVLLVSGGNTMIVLMKDINYWQVLGKTKDDAVGEAFDKVARMLGLPYPGGPAIEALAKKGNPKAIQFPRPLLREKNYNFSFSGLKTAVLYYLRDHKNSLFTDVAASFQAAAIDVLVKKTERAVAEFGARSVVLCGGVAANTALRAALQKSAENFNATFIAPAMDYNTDNAAMIAVAAYMRVRRRGKAYPLVADATLSL